MIYPRQIILIFLLIFSFSFSISYAERNDAQGAIMRDSSSVNIPQREKLVFTDQGVSFDFCYNWSCNKNLDAFIDNQFMKDVSLKIDACSISAEDELFAIRNAVRKIEAYLLRRNPVLGSDIGGNHVDTKSPGRLDCVDNASNTNNILHALSNYRKFKHWAIQKQIKNKGFTNIMQPHWTAVLKTTDRNFIKKYSSNTGIKDGDKSTTWTVDTWLTTFAAKPFLIEHNDWQNEKLASVVWSHRVYSKMYHTKGCWGR